MMEIQLFVKILFYYKMLSSTLADFKYKNDCRTRNIPNMAKLSVCLFLMVLVNLSWADITTTGSPSQDLDDTPLVTGSGNGEYPVDSTTENALVTEIEETASNSPNDAEVVAAAAEHDNLEHEDKETTTYNPESTTKSVVEQKSTTASPAPVCKAPGFQAHDSECQLYHECSWQGSQDGSLELVTRSCPEREAFNDDIKRCSRDVSSCKGNINCVSKGLIADPDSNSSYYLCQPRFTGQGYHIFHINCAENQVYYPALGSCFVDLNDDSPSFGFPTYGFGKTDDIFVVRRELKQLKRDYKLKLKREREEQKEAERLKKKQEKLRNKARKEEASNFECPTATNYPSQIAENLYIACFSTNKGKVSATAMECSPGTTFNKKTHTCTKKNQSEEDHSSSDDE